MNIAYLDCFSGVSGDMFVGSLIDAGLDINELEQTLSGLNLDGYKIEAKKEKRNSIFGTKFSVLQHDIKQTIRNLKDIKKLLNESDLLSIVIDKSIAVFDKLANAEAKIHNVSSEDIHFHEVGAIDSIVDIVSSVAGVYILGIEKLICSKIPLGTGITSCAHGEIPIPSPATVEILKGIPVYQTDQEWEMVTPTGAALVSSLCCSYGNIPLMNIAYTGYGVGSRILSDRPNLLRIIIGEEIDERILTDTVLVLESNLDDMNPELLGYLMDSLFDSGALDVNFTHIQMKKNRPGVRLQVIASPDKESRLVDTIFKESTTLGIRIAHNKRVVLKREEIAVDSPWGRVKVKKVIKNGKTVKILPEYEECRKIAKENELPLRDVYAWAGGLSKNLK